MAAVDEGAVDELEGGSGLHRHDPVGGAGGEGPRPPRAQVKVRTPARVLGLRRRGSLETKKQIGSGGARCFPSISISSMNNTYLNIENMATAGAQVKRVKTYSQHNS